MDDVMLSAMFGARFFWTGEGKQRNLGCYIGDRGLMARVPTEHSYFDEDSGEVVTTQTTLQEVIEAARRLVAVLNGQLTWRDVDRECQQHGADFDTQCRRMGLDPKKVRKQKADELKKASSG
jgi:hypothetical protein